MIPTPLIEELAELEHKQWSHWIDYLAESQLSFKVMNRWMKQAITRYELLTEKEKESDREWALKVLEVINKRVLCLKAEIKKINWSLVSEKELLSLVDVAFQIGEVKE